MGTHGSDTKTNKTALELIEAMGYEAGQMAAAQLVGMLRGFADGLSSYGLSDIAEAAANVTDIGADEEPERDIKTAISDCRNCWCNTCANLEDCIDCPPDGWEVQSLTPYPCIGCNDGKRFMPKDLKDGEKCHCAGYVEGGVNYG